MKEKLRKYLPRVWKFCLNWNELMLLPIMFIFLLISTPFLRLFSSTAGAFDIGVLQTVFVAGFVFAFGSFITWITYRLNFPTLAKWLDDIMERSLSNKSANPDDDNFKFKKATMALTVYFLYFILFCWVVTSLF